MTNLKDYFFNINNYSDPEIKKFIFDSTGGFNSTLLIGLNKEFINCYLKEMEQKDEWAISKNIDVLENLFDAEVVKESTNVLCRFYSFSDGIFVGEDKKEQFDNLNYSQHMDMTNKIYAFQFCMHEIINAENSKVISQYKAKSYAQNLGETPKERNKENPFPLIFVDEKVYNCFKEYTRKHILDFYSDYSYLKKRLEIEKLIHRHTDNSFIEFLLKDVRLISQKDFESYLGKYESKLKSLSKSYNINRQNNFNTVFENLLKSE